METFLCTVNKLFEYKTICFLICSPFKFCVCAYCVCGVLVCGRKMDIEILIKKINVNCYDKDSIAYEKNKWLLIYLSGTNKHVMKM